jgi:hypothetical protein
MLNEEEDDFLHFKICKEEPCWRCDSIMSLYQTCDNCLQLGHNSALYSHNGLVYCHNCLKEKFPDEANNEHLY